MCNVTGSALSSYRVSITSEIRVEQTRVSAFVPQYPTLLSIKFLF